MKLKLRSRHGSTAILQKPCSGRMPPQISELPNLGGEDMLGEIMNQVEKALRMQQKGGSNSSLTSTTVDNGGISENSHNYDNAQAPIGALRIVIQSANIQGISLRQRMIRVSPRPFVRLRIQGHNEILYQTTWKIRTTQPNWFTESRDIMLYSLTNMLQFDVMEQHRIRRPTNVGTAFFDLGVLAREPTHIGEERVIHPPKSSSRYIMGEEGTLLFDVFYYPIVRAPNANDRLASWEIDKKPDPVGAGVAFKSDAESGIPSGSFSSNAGIVTLRIVQARGLEWDTNVVPRPTTLLATAHLGWSEEPIHRTTPYTPGAAAAQQQTHRTSDLDSPEIPAGADLASVIWDSGFDFICYSRDTTTVVIKIADHTTSCFGMKRKQTVFAHLSVSLEALLCAKQEQSEGGDGACWWPLSGCRQGSVQLSARWMPLQIPRKPVYRKPTQ